jgi:hypothetical protein
MDKYIIAASTRNKIISYPGVYKITLAPATEDVIA